MPVLHTNLKIWDGLCLKSLSCPLAYSVERKNSLETVCVTTVNIPFLCNLYQIKLKHKWIASTAKAREEKHIISDHIHKIECNYLTVHPRSMWDLHDFETILMETELWFSTKLKQEKIIHIHKHIYIYVC